ncbi:MAG: isoaspartyl peptidase/L-asparaginase [Myxococcota bacterium]
MNGWSVIVHGGAGAIPGPFEADHRKGCSTAVAAAVSVLQSGGTAVDAACAAVVTFERDPLFNAGVGAALDEDGLPAHDAAVMRGHDQAYGGVAAVVGVQSPIELARAVMEDGRHCLLAGPGAVRFARRVGHPVVDPSMFETDRSRTAWKVKRAKIIADGWDDDRAPWNPGEGTALDSDQQPVGNTVGAVVRTADGRTAAATSTGGLLMRYAGRIGDTPIAGAGTYARDDVGALSATGHGETMMRTVFAYVALQAMHGSEVPHRRLRSALDNATKVGGGRGGAIAILADGRCVHARTTRAMGTAWQYEGGAIQTAFLPEEEDGQTRPK